MGTIGKMRLFWAGIIVLLVVFSVFMLRNNQENYDNTTETTQTEEKTLNNQENTQNNQETEQNTQEPTGISINELAQHKNKDSCWVVYEGKVYDIASYLPRHPGGEQKIMENCGDPEAFQTAFTKKHGTSKVSLLMKMGTFIGDFDIMGEIA